MKLKNETKSAIKSLSVIITLFGILSFYGFNCAPPSFQVSDQASLSLSADGGLAPTGTPTYDTKPILPQALLTSPQIYQSLLNLTEQTNSVSNNQMNEFSRREGAFAVSSELNLVNAPMMLALASFSGEVCNGLVQREQALAADSRKYFQSINFQDPVQNISMESYNSIVTNMTKSFWGRDPSAEELALFNTYRTEFTTPETSTSVQANNSAQTKSSLMVLGGSSSSSSTTTQQSPVQQTRSLVLSTCAAVLSSFDVFSY